MGIAGDDDADTGLLTIGLFIFCFVVLAGALVVGVAFFGEVIGALALRPFDRGGALLTSSSSSSPSGVSSSMGSGTGSTKVVGSGSSSSGSDLASDVIWNETISLIESPRRVWSYAIFLST